MENEKIKITQGSIYIFQGVRPTNDTEFIKFKITEITRETYFIENLDSGCSFRIGISNFLNRYKPIEIIEDIETMLQDLAKPSKTSNGNK